MQHREIIFQIGKEFGKNPLRSESILHGYFENLIEMYKKKDPEITVLFWPKTSYSHIDESFKVIMEGYGYEVERTETYFQFGDWGATDNRVPFETGYPCAYILNYNDYVFDEEEEEWGCSKGYLAKKREYLPLRVKDEEYLENLLPLHLLDQPSIPTPPELPSTIFMDVIPYKIPGTYKCLNSKFIIKQHESSFVFVIGIDEYGTGIREKLTSKERETALKMGLCME